MNILSVYKEEGRGERGGAALLIVAHGLSLSLVHFSCATMRSRPPLSLPSSLYIFNGSAWWETTKNNLYYQHPILAGVGET